MLTNPADYPAPVTPEEMAREAKRAFDEGASVVHVHFRGRSRTWATCPRGSPEVATAIVAAIRDACPGIIVNQTTGVIGDDITGPLKCLAAVRPEIAALNAGSLNYLEDARRRDLGLAAAAVRQSGRQDPQVSPGDARQGIEPEFECFDLGMVRTAAAIARNCGYDGPPKYNLVMGVESGMPADPELLPYLMRFVAAGARWSVTAIGRKEIWPLHRRAAELGGDLRTGLEDSIQLPDGSRAASNGDLVRELVAIARETGRAIASPEEARAALRLSQNRRRRSHDRPCVRRRSLEPVLQVRARGLPAESAPLRSREIEPYANDWDEAGEFPRELYRKAAEVGYMGLGFPERYGGTEGDRFMRIIAMQEIARAGCGGVGAGLFSHTIGAPPILHRGSDEMKARVLPQILSGEKISALAITEPSGGSDVANLRTTARRDGDHYVINGSKTFITSGMRADFITLAVAHRRPRRERRQPRSGRGQSGRPAAHAR